MKKINFKEKIKNNKHINKFKQKIAYRNHFRFTKTKEGDKYRLSKRLKHQSKQVRVDFIKKICTRPMNLLELLIKIGIYKKTSSLKLIFVFVPFVLLLITDNFIIATIITTINIFFCAMIFSMTTTEKKEACINGNFDYGMYKYIQAKKQTIAIIVMFLITLLLIIIGHKLLINILQLFNSVIEN